MAPLGPPGVVITQYFHVNFGSKLVKNKYLQELCLKQALLKSGEGKTSSEYPTKKIAAVLFGDVGVCLILWLDFWRTGKER